MLKKKWLSILLAVVMVLAIVPMTALAVDDPATTEIEIETADELAAAIKNQEAGQTWVLKANTYNLSHDQLNQYAEWGTSVDGVGQGNWYFPIHEDGITIKGEGNVVITSDVETKNGVWASQDFISVWADNVTIENVDIKSKQEVNKAIEVMGKDFKLLDSDLLRVNGEGSGSIIFSGSDIGNATIENVTLYSWISANYAKTGTLNTTNVTIDFTENFYAGYSSDGVYGWNPGVFNFRDGCNVKVNNSGLNIIVDSEINLTKQVFNGNLQPGTTVTLTQYTTIDSMLDIATDNVTLDLGGNAILAADNFTSTFPNDSHLVNVTGDNVTIKNGILQTRATNKHVLNIYEAQNVTVEDMILDHTYAANGAPMVVNGSTVTVAGEFKTITGNNSWYAVNVDNKTDTTGANTSLTFQDNAVVTFDGVSKLGIVMESSNKDVNTTVSFGKGVQVVAAEGFVVVAKGAAQNGTFTVNNPENAGLDYDAETGIAVPHKHVFGSDWKNNAEGHWKECACGEKSEYALHTLKWVVDKEATATADGSKHQECTICGYKTAAETIPATGEDSDSNNPDTGDSNVTLWFALLGVSFVGLAGAFVANKKRKTF